jgi:hypothetical protein
MINHIQESCGKGVVNTPTIIYEDNVACVAQMHMGYVILSKTKKIVRTNENNYRNKILL